MFDVVVKMLGEADAVLAQECTGGSFGGAVFVSHGLTAEECSIQMPCLVPLTRKYDDFQSFSWATLR